VTTPEEIRERYGDTLSFVELDDGLKLLSTPK